MIARDGFFYPILTLMIDSYISMKKNHISKVGNKKEEFGLLSVEDKYSFKLFFLLVANIGVY